MYNITELYRYLSGYEALWVLLQAEDAGTGEAAPMEVSAPSTSGAAADSPAPAANGEAATPGTEGTAKKVKKEKKVWLVFTQ